MKEKNLKQNYQNACERLIPSPEAVKEVLYMKKQKNYLPVKRRAFVSLAAALIAVFSISVGAVAATDGEIIEEMKGTLSILFPNGTETIPEGALVVKQMVKKEDGSYLITTGKGEESNVVMTYYETEKRLTVSVNGEETDITEVLNRDGIYTAQYQEQGKTYRLTVTGTPEHAESTVEPLE